MAVSFIVFGFSLLGFALAAVPMTQEKVSVSVFFESYCPDSVKFVTKQLYPVFLSPLGAYMNVTLNPYGKATTKKTDTGMYEFVCHHGEKECVGNKVIACVLMSKDMTFESQFKFINCTSTLIAANTKMENYPISECATMSGFNADTIMECSTSTAASEYLAEFGNKTSDMFKPLASVPTVVLNEKYVAAENEMAVKDLKKAVCSKISGTKPAECIGSSAVTLQTALLPVFAVVAILSRL